MTMPTTQPTDVCEVSCVHPEAVATAKSALPDEPCIVEATNFLKLLGDPTRLKILSALKARELCVCDLSAATGISEATLSQSLRLLRASRVVTGRREGRNVFYRLSDTHVRLLLDITREHVTHDSQASSASSALDAL